MLACNRESTWDFAPELFSRAQLILNNCNRKRNDWPDSDNKDKLLIPETGTMAVGGRAYTLNLDTFPLACQHRPPYLSIQIIAPGGSFWRCSAMRKGETDASICTCLSTSARDDAARRPPVNLPSRGLFFAPSEGAACIDGRTEWI